MSKISIIIPTYNTATYLAEAIGSVLGQTFTNFEIIVVDDGSTDHTRAVLQSFTDLRLRSVFQKNQGLAAARNTGLQAATGDYVTFLDSDDFYLPTKLELQVSILDREPSCGVVYSDVCYCDAGGNPGRRVAETLGFSTLPSGNVLEMLAQRNFLPVSSAMVRLSLLDSTMRFDEQLKALEDWDFWMRLACVTIFRYEPGPVANYRIHDNMMSRDYPRMWKAALLVREKLHAMPQFESLSLAIRQRSYFQLGKLHCLVGDAQRGRRALKRAIIKPPRIPKAVAVWILSFLGGRFLQAIQTFRLKRAMGFTPHRANV